MSAGFQIEMPCIWGEATAHSSPFYERALNVNQILDHFFIEDEVMRYCRERLRKAREQTLARRTAKQETKTVKLKLKSRRQLSLEELWATSFRPSAGQARVRTPLAMV